MSYPRCLIAADIALLYGMPGDRHHGLLGMLSGGSAPTPPGTMTRQRRRAEARAAAAKSTSV